jgi:nucleotide-binding universal stress UspA family protein
MSGGRMSGDRPRRVLVALDASPHSLAALQAAAELSQDPDAELTAVYVWDLELVHAFGRPGARAVSRLSGSAVALSPAELLAAMRAQAERADVALRDLAGGGRPWRFATRRGVVADTLRAMASEVDLVALGRAGWTWPHPGGRGATMRALAAEGRADTLILAEGQRLRPPVRLVLDRLAGSERAIALALDLAERLGGPLQVLPIGPSAGDLATLRRALAERLAGRRADLRPGLVVAGPSTPEALAAAGPAGLVVLPVAIVAELPGGAGPLLDTVCCPLLILRAEAETAPDR